MIRSLIRPNYRWACLLCLVLLAACGKKEETKPAPALTEKQAASLRLQVEELRTQAMDLSSQIAELRRQHMAVMTELTSQSQHLAASLNNIDDQLQGKPVSIAIRPVSANKGADRAKGPIGPFARFMLIVISLCAIWIIARLFLKHLSEDEEEEDDDFAADEESPNEAEASRASQTPAPAPPPAPEAEIKNPLENEAQHQNNEGAEHKG